MWSLPNRPSLTGAMLLFFTLAFGHRPCLAQTKDPLPPRPKETSPTPRLDMAPRLADRVQDTPATVVRLFKDAGMSPRAHVLTVNERRLVAQSLAALPPLYQRVLQTRLRSLSFLDNMPNTALTSTVESTSPSPLFDITIRAGILQQTASEWLTEKERTCFTPNDSTVQVAIEGGARAALDYVLMHEATHVIDATLKLTPTSSATGQLLDSAAAKPFTAGVWQRRTLPTPAWRHALLLQIPFRRGGKALPITKAAQVYASLQQTPFVSLYGSSSWTEDLAEYLTVYYFTHRLHQPFRIVLRQHAQELWAYEPMQSGLVRRRMRQLKHLLA
ncbi:hypothetical protein FNT36_13675 [Hymenobacter setariae]|uniref:Secreted protein n=1 Tax=Hymenobacter setariae TaxID=2594794 RepID=A0A558BVK4_9BACT|nr:hypothetical protein [Hymenobacter setariae]TVT40522.1 hypothetical protein FNT36_13675 [Hymenobacter setariae]